MLRCVVILLVVVAAASDKAADDDNNVIACVSPRPDAPSIVCGQHKFDLGFSDRVLNTNLGAYKFYLQPWDTIVSDATTRCADDTHTNLNSPSQTFVPNGMTTWRLLLCWWRHLPDTVIV